MTILSRADLVTAIATIDDGGVNTAAEVRSVLIDIMDSTLPQGMQLTNGADTINLTATPTKVATFTAISADNPLFTGDLVNNEINVLDSMAALVGFRFYGDWAATEDAVFEIYINGLAHPTDPIFATSPGQGVGDPADVWTTNRLMLINAAMIAAGEGGNTAQLSLYGYSTTGNFTINQADIECGISYIKGTIGAVG